MKPLWRPFLPRNIAKYSQGGSQACSPACSHTCGRRARSCGLSGACPPALPACNGFPTHPRERAPNTPPPLWNESWDAWRAQHHAQRQRAWDARNAYKIALRCGFACTGSVCGFLYPEYFMLKRCLLSLSLSLSLSLTRSPPLGCFCSNALCRTCSPHSSVYVPGLSSASLPLTRALSLTCRPPSSLPLRSSSLPPIRGPASVLLHRTPRPLTR